MAQSFTVASEVLAYCTSCKMDLNHVVVAMKGDRIVKVQCLTCRKDHAYKAAKGVTEPQKTSTSRGSHKSEAEEGRHSVEMEWSKLMTAHQDAPLKTYNAKGQFNLGDKLHHPKFGDGIVGKLIYPNKLEVIFRTDVKILIYSGHAL